MSYIDNIRARHFDNLLFLKYIIFIYAKISLLRSLIIIIIGMIKID